MDYKEEMFRYGLLLSLTAITVYKIRNGSQWFLAQPCHVAALIFLLLLSLTDGRHPFGHFAFNVMIHQSWGT
jgi:hypothetical protein